MSTAYHPQTDGQTERMNRTLEEALRSYINPDQTDWNKHLTAIEVAYNSSHQDSTQMTPFELNYGREIFLPRQIISQGISTPAALDFITTLEANLQHAKSALVKAKERQTSNANTKRRETQF